MTKTALRACPICDHREVEVLHHQKFVLPTGNILPEAYDVVWCANCGFAYADTSAQQEDYDRYYAAFSKYEDNKTSTGGGGSSWDAYRLRETAAAIAVAVPDRQTRVMDIGCANGGLLGELKALGYIDVVGVDPSLGCVANAQGLYGIEAHAGSIREMPALGKFDLVILSHVLEHVADLQSTMRDLVALLREGGRCYVEVPDATRYSDSILAPFQDFNTEHINHFSLSALRNLFSRGGFAVESVGQKIIETSPGCPYPTAYIFFRRDNGTRDLEIDDLLRASLLDYIEGSREKLEALERQLSKICAADKPLLVWGAGQLTMKLLAETSLAKAKIVAFLDGNPINQGKAIRGIPVLPPEQVRSDGTPILIATLLHQSAISATIREKLKLTNPIKTLEEV